MFEKDFKFSRLEGIDLTTAFGVNPTRSGVLFNKLVTLANIMPRFTYIAEALLNDNTFTQEEKVLGIFALGKAMGMVDLVKASKMDFRFTTTDMFGILVKMFLGKRDPKPVDRILGGNLQ